MMTCLKITESQNGQIYPEDTFSHGAAHMLLTNLKRLGVGGLPSCYKQIVIYCDEVKNNILC